MEAGSDDFIARMHMESKLNETEDLALFALEAYERADKQRTELYYQAKSSNSLAAKTLMESLNGGGGETCKALAKQRKVLSPSGGSGKGTSPHRQATSGCCR